MSSIAWSAIDWISLVTLSLFVLIVALLFMEQPSWQPYFVLIVATAILWSGVRSVLEHLDAAAARAFNLATVAGLLILAVSIGEVLLQARRQRRQREQSSSTVRRERVPQ